MPARILALLAAVAMVVGAVFLRGRLDERKEDKAHPLRLACAVELAQFCQDILGNKAEWMTVEHAGTTADRLASAASAEAAGIDGWVTLSPWPQMVDQARLAAGLPAFFGRTERLAATPLAMAVQPGRSAALQTLCGTPRLTCLGEAARKQTWPAIDPKAAPGAVRIALPSPATSAAGLAVLGAATLDFFGGRADLSTTDLEDPAYQDWLVGLSRAATPVDINTFLTTPAADVLVGLDAEVRPAIDASARLPKPAALYPSPNITVQAVVAVVPGRSGQRLGDAVAEGKSRLSEMGWRDVPAGSDGLPDPGLMAALRKAWRA